MIFFFGEDIAIAISKLIHAYGPATVIMKTDYAIKRILKT